MNAAPATDHDRLTVLLATFITRKHPSVEELSEALSVARVLDVLPSGGPTLGNDLFDLLMRIMRRKFGLPVDFLPSLTGNSVLHGIQEPRGRDTGELL